MMTIISKDRRPSSVKTRLWDGTIKINQEPIQWFVTYTITYISTFNYSSPLRWRGHLPVLMKDKDRLRLNRQYYDRWGLGDTRLKLVSTGLPCVPHTNDSQWVARKCYDAPGWGPPTLHGLSVGERWTAKILLLYSHNMLQSTNIICSTWNAILWENRIQWSSNLM